LEIGTGALARIGIPEHDQGPSRGENWSRCDPDCSRVGWACAARPSVSGVQIFRSRRSLLGEDLAA